MSKQYDPYTDPGFGYSCLCGDYDHGTVPERIICAACKVEEQKQQLATLTQERDALVKELAVTKGALAIFEQNSAACAEEFEGRLKAEKERDALRDSLLLSSASTGAGGVQDNVKVFLVTHGR